jgi:hypothetical protein
MLVLAQRVALLQARPVPRKAFRDAKGASDGRGRAEARPYNYERGTL